MTDRSPAAPWTPDLPLRADATDEQIDLRAGWLQGYVLGANGDYNRDSVPFRRAQSKPVIDGPSAAIIVARELASAVSLERDAELADVTANHEQLNHRTHPIIMSASKKEVAGVSQPPTGEFSEAVRLLRERATALSVEAERADYAECSTDGPSRLTLSSGKYPRQHHTGCRRTSQPRHPHQPRNKT